MRTLPLYLKGILLISLSLFSFSISGQSVIYSQSSSAWSSTASWSLARSGPSCGCTPTALDSVVIQSSHRITISTTGNVAKHIAVETTGSLLSGGTGLKDITIAGGSFSVGPGGFVSPDAGNSLGITFSSGTNTISTGANASVTFEEINVLGLAELFISNTGTGALRTTNFNLYSSAEVINNASAVTVNSDLIFDSATNIRFTNNGAISINGTMEFDPGGTGIQIKVRITNNGVLNTNDLNFNGALDFENNATINQTGDFVGMSSSGFITNNSIWNWSGTLYDNQISFKMDLTPIGNRFVYNRSGDQPIIPITPSYQIMEIAGSGIKTLDGNVQIEDELEFTSAHLALGSSNLTIGDGATITGTSSSQYIVTNGAGTLKISNVLNSSGRDAFFPIGTSVSSYSPVTIISFFGSADNFSARVQDHVLNQGTSGSMETNNAVDKTWFLEEEVAGGSQMIFNFGWSGADELPDFDRSITSLFKFTTSWNQVGFNAYNASGGDPYEININQPANSLGIFSLATYGSPLPITLSYFTAELENERVLLKWETLNELNNDYFTIEKSYDSQNWKIVSEIPGAGNSSLPLQYSSMDNQSARGITYYRLKQTDFDGAFSYSSIISVESNHEASGLLKVFPNPTKGIIYVNKDEVDVSRLQVVDQTGRNYRHLVPISIASESDVAINLTSLPAGIYYLKTGDHSIKILKK